MARSLNAVEPGCGSLFETIRGRPVKPLTVPARPRRPSASYVRGNEKDAMASKPKSGDRVSWKTSQGETRGKVIKKLPIEK
jgi:hypothetical protein